MRADTKVLGTPPTCLLNASQRSFFVFFFCLFGRPWSGFNVSPLCLRQRILQGFPHAVLSQLFGVHKGGDSVTLDKRCDSTPRVLFLKKCLRRKVPRRQSTLCSGKTRGEVHEGPDLLSIAFSFPIVISDCVDVR